MAAILNNPFKKINPFRAVYNQSFNYPNLPRQKHYSDYAHLIYRQKHPVTVSPKPLKNIWNFHQDNINKNIDFSRRTDFNLSQVSDFQVRMRISSLHAPNQNKALIAVLQERLDNPFYRKNLLTNLKQVKIQVQADLFLYKGNISNQNTIIKDYAYEQRSVMSRPRASLSQYETKMKNPTVSHYINSPQNLNDTLGYSKTPYITQGGNTNRYVQQHENLADPKVIKVQGKSFFQAEIVSFQ